MCGNVKHIYERHICVDIIVGIDDLNSNRNLQSNYFKGFCK
jgi:hypothetical protein